MDRVCQPDLAGGLPPLPSPSSLLVQTVRDDDARDSPRSGAGFGCWPKPLRRPSLPTASSAWETVTKMFSSSLVLESEGVQDSSFKFQGANLFFIIEKKVSEELRYPAGIKEAPWGNSLTRASHLVGLSPLLALPPSPDERGEGRRGCEGYPSFVPSFPPLRPSLLLRARGPPQRPCILYHLASD